MHNWPSGRRWYSAGWVARLWLVLEGNIEVRDPDNDALLYLKAGDIFFGDARTYDVFTPQGAQWLSLGWHATAFTTINLLQLLHPPRIWQPDDISRRLLETLLHALAECWHGTPDIPVTTPDSLLDNSQIVSRHDAAVDLTCRSLAGAILGHCWHLVDVDQLNAAGTNVPTWLTAALRRLHDDPAVDIAAVAHEVGLSPAQFRRSFRQWTGAAPRDYLKEQRLRTARRLLESTDLPVTIIARRLGYKSSSHFIRLWQRSHGLSPARHRAATKSARV